jgi:hypothetical protein
MNASQATAARAGAVPATAPTFKTLRLMIDRIVADQPTREIDQDEITLTAVVPLARKAGADKAKLEAKSEQGNVINAGKFKKGEARDFNPPKLLAHMPFGPRQGNWPREQHVTALMIEVDRGKLEPIVAAVIDAVDKDVTKLLATAATSVATTVAAAALAGSSLGSVVPVIGTAVGAAVAAAGGAAFAAIKNAREDDPFHPAKVTVKLAAYPAKAGRLPGSEFTLRLTSEKGGVYRVIGWWEVA